MKSRDLSLRNLLLCSLTAMALVAALWYWGFYLPIQQDLSRIQLQSQQIDARLVEAASSLSKMDSMEKTLREADPVPNARAQVAPYDNKQAVLTELNGILQNSQEYDLQFADPVIQDDGIVRRIVVMNFRCSSYSSVQGILHALTEGPWLCLISNLSLSGSGDIMDGAVEVRATVTYLENTRLK